MDCVSIIIIIFNKLLYTCTICKLCYTMDSCIMLKAIDVWFIVHFCSYINVMLQKLNLMKQKKKTTTTNNNNTKKN